MSIDAIIDDCRLPVTRYEPVHGGDINQAYCLYTHDDKYFLKVNDSKSFPLMFDKEAFGLRELQLHTSLVIPQPIHYGEIEGKQYLLLNWLQPGTPSTKAWQQFGSALADMHKVAQPYFGYTDDNYIGSLYQTNERRETWHLFYAEYRIEPLAKLLFEVAAFTKQDLKNATRLCESLDQRFPVEPPSLLHGDLWSGNFMFTDKGMAAIYDPAVYYGHREMDLGMSLLFGGFDAKFYDAYHETYPLDSGWRQRLPVTQLYPLLVHAVLFGGHYVAKCRSILNSV